jgi:ParB family chromosome partitioning protein
MSELKKKGLGRGLSALFGDAKKEISGNVNSATNKVALIGELTRNQFQPRLTFDEKKLDQLSESIKNNGLIQPIAVRTSALNQNKYEIIAGERRWIAAQKAGLHEVPIIVLDLSDNETLEVAIVENIQREDLNVIEEARAYERLNKEFGYDQEKIAKMMSKSRSHVSNTLRLLVLPKDVVSLIEEGKLTAGQARPLIGLSDPSSIAEEVVNKKLSARSVENLAKAKKDISKNSIADVNILSKQNELEEILGLKVLINNKKNNSGKILIEYRNLEQFDLVSNLLKKL